jgi:hypothetical protein
MSLEKRLPLALLLSFVVLFGWGLLQGAALHRENEPHVGHRLLDRGAAQRRRLVPPGSNGAQGFVLEHHVAARILDHRLDDPTGLGDDEAQRHPTLPTEPLGRLGVLRQELDQRHRGRKACGRGAVRPVLRMRRRAEHEHEDHDTAKHSHGFVSPVKRSRYVRIING